MLSLVPQTIETEEECFKISSCNFKKIYKLLKNIYNSSSEESIQELEMLIFPLKLKKINLLNIDANNALVAWMNDHKPY